MLSAALLGGCSDQVRLPTPDQLAAFERAAAVEATVDMDRIRRAKLHTGPYRVIPGDVLEFTLPALLQAGRTAEVQAAQAGNHPPVAYVCRVSNAGTITLPGADELSHVTGLSLAEIEERVVAAYQEQVRQRPSVFIRVLEYRTAKVYIAGAVEKPGVYTLRSDQMTLVSLLTEAGGIAVPAGTGTTAAGAAVVRIVRSDEPPGLAAAGPAAAVPPETTGSQGPAAASLRPDSAKEEKGEGPLCPTGPAAPGSEERPPRAPGITLPVVGLTIPFQDVALEEGDTIIVEQVQVPLFTVVGLVNKPGNYEYLPTAHYNLMQALAFAGGLDLVAEPRYATIYRLTPEGAIIRVPFQLVADNALTDAQQTPIRPGDVIAIEHTPRTRMNTVLRSLVRFNTGLYVTGRDLWE